MSGLAQRKSFFRCAIERSAWSIVPHSTEKTMSRGQPLRTMSMTFAQSITPSPQAQPTGVPVTLPRSALDCWTEMSLAWRWTSLFTTRRSQR